MKYFHVFLIVVFWLFIGCDAASVFSGYLASEIKNQESHVALASREISSKTYQDFLDAIRTFESDVDPQKAQYYSDNYDNPNASSYQAVEYPGRVVRDENGHPLMETTSIKRLFEKLGIDQYYTKGSKDPNMFKRMQYAVVNFIGFVGYQFSERDLWDLNYYTHYDDKGREEYYSDFPDSTWAHGIRDKIEGNIHYTDVNTWKGTFTGKHGINSYQDFIDPAKQDFIARDHFTFKYNNIVSALEKEGKTLADYIGTTLYWDQCNPKISPPPGGRANAVEVTMSGLLAGAHLRGAAGVVALLVKHENHADEIGTRILQYVQDFGGYQTPFKDYYFDGAFAIESSALQKYH